MIMIAQPSSSRWPPSASGLFKFHWQVLDSDPARVHLSSAGPAASEDHHWHNAEAWMSESPGIPAAVTGGGEPE